MSSSSLKQLQKRSDYISLETLKTNRPKFPSKVSYRDKVPKLKAWVKCFHPFFKIAWLSLEKLLIDKYFPEKYKSITIHSSDMRVESWFKCILTILDDIPLPDECTWDSLLKVDKIENFDFMWSESILHCWKSRVNCEKTYSGRVSNYVAAHATLNFTSVTGGRMTLARLTYLFLNPVDCKKVFNDQNSRGVVSHRCGQGLAVMELKWKGNIGNCKKWTCCNPYHLSLTNGKKFNRSQEGCAFGCRALCIHDSIIINMYCIFTSSLTGKRFPCLNSTEFEQCSCDVDCYSSSKAEKLERAKILLGDRYKFPDDEDEDDEDGDLDDIDD